MQTNLISDGSKMNDVRHVYLLSPNDAHTVNLILNLQNAGYHVKHFMTLVSIENACKENEPNIIILDLEVEKNISDEEMISSIKCKIPDNTSILIISDNNNLDKRLEMAKIGIDRYFGKPFSAEKIVNTVNGLFEQVSSSAYKVLLIDNDKPFLTFCTEMLRQKEFEVEAFSNPLDGLDIIESFRPDVIVLDLYMPNCTGEEFIDVLHQDDELAYIPIILLSGEGDISRQVSALKHGAVEFFEKPVNSEKLTTSVSLMANRSRKHFSISKRLSSALNDNKYHLITNNEHNIVSVTDVTGKITHVNKKFCEISGYSTAELIGKNHRVLKSDYHSDSFYKELWQKISSGKVWRGTICNHTKAGNKYWVESTIVPFLDEKGVPYRYVSARTDVTEIRESEEALKKAQQLSSLGSWRINDGELIWTDEIYHIFGKSKDTFTPTMDAYYSAIPDSDLPRIVEAKNNAVIMGEFNVIHQVIRPDGEVRYIHELAKTENDKEGNKALLSGTMQDITRRVRLEQEIEKKTKTLNMLNISTTKFVEEGDLHEVMNLVLPPLLDITQSEYGFFGEVLYDDDIPYLKTHAISNIAWDADTQTLYEKSLKSGFEFRNLKTLFGKVLTTGKAVISNNPSKDPDSGGLPEGHPEMNSFMGVPVYYGDAMVGMYAVANKTDGYNESMIELLHHFNVGYGVMINSKRMMDRDALNYDKLVKAKDEANEANKAKSQFLSSMSHELRTPMNAIIGFSQLLTMDADPPLSEVQNENVHEITRAGNHLLTLIDEVLDLSKIESGRVDLSIESVSMGNALLEALQLINSLAQTRGIKIFLFANGNKITHDKISEKINAVRADSVRLKQVILNLLSNAVKYNKKNGTIEIHCDEVEPDTVRLSVIDDGIGLNREQQSQLFMPFNRLGAEQTNTQGVGIGLVITKRIVELMGGKVGVDCAKGKGCRFWIDLIKDNSQEVRKIQDLKHLAENKSLLSANELAGEKTVLYIEDNPANLRLVTQMMRRLSNIKLLSAHEPFLGLELANEHNFDLILLDINLPGIDGYEVFKRLQNNVATKNIPVIGISANAMKKDISKGLKVGFNDYITKPIDILKLMAAVDKVLQCTKNR